jgi:hypothetical protein
LIILAILTIFGVQNLTLAIVLTGLYVGSNIWLGFRKIAK